MYFSHFAPFFTEHLYTTASDLQIKKKVCNFIKKETLIQVFSCGFCKIFNNTFVTEHIWKTASDM